MAKIHKSAMVNLDSNKPVVLDLPELAAGLREKMLARPDAAGPEAQSATLASGPDAARRNAAAEAASILADARAQAEQLMTVARREAAAIREQACQAGFQAGRQAGQEDAARQAGQLGERLQQDYGRLADQLRQDNSRLIENLEPEILELSLQIAGKILDLELSRHDEAFLGVVNLALSHFKQGEKLSLTVSKNDYWRSLVSSTYAINGGADGLTILADDNLPDGSCIVESAAGAIDAGVPTQLAQIRNALQAIDPEDQA